MVSKEYWANLSDEDKSKIIRRFWEHPVLILELVDPLMAEMILSWMYAKVELPNGERSEVPFMGYHIVELVFDKVSLMKFTNEEKNVLNHAMNILKSRGI